MNTLFLGLALMAATAAPPGLPDNTAAPPISTRTIREAIAAPAIAPAIESSAGVTRALASSQPVPVTFRPRHVKSAKMRAAVAGAVAGLFAGATIGYVVTNTSGCDTCGLAGICYGMPIGSVVGGVIGAKLVK
jgi:hypothetical protein